MCQLLFQDSVDPLSRYDESFGESFFSPAKVLFKVYSKHSLHLLTKEPSCTMYSKVGVNLHFFSDLSRTRLTRLLKLAKLKTM